MSAQFNPYLAHLNNNNNNYNNNRNYNNNSSHRIHLNVNAKGNDVINSSKSFKAKSVFSSNGSFHPYNSNVNNKTNSLNGKFIKSNKFIYGNYEHYYGYRNKSSIPIDPRIELFNEEWFHNKKCLDVGCNSGFLTVSLAMLFEPKIIEGVDIDPHLIKKAQNYLIFRNSLIKNQDIKENKEQNIQLNENEKLFDYYPISCPLTIGSIPIPLNNYNLEKNKKKEIEKEYNDFDININKCKKNPEESDFTENTMEEKEKKENEIREIVIENDNNNEIEAIKESQFPNNVYFRVSDWVNEPTIEESKDSYDIILGLSITKWIHLNWGDYGIKRFFNKVYSSLRNNGIFILEPQPFSGYSRKAKNNKVI
ncbi:hypothetical protein BCR36DRAFT_341114 [Piromyces finnis]|uniref:RNA methyltransferase n=1 Tax=Piromyces finnis TaxID=1754191 RepID=A0A1Y1VNK5_9FUNG|nr:hypothetical protein BCR36DRAFT_341114 [Piromyces finnis]|eukprot:ORX60994.1 hypothetical protein BCR36DRAFT_341114 [Piromyces finnis]